VREVSVVGYEQETFAVEVEPADRIDIFANAKQVDHRRAL